MKRSQALSLLTLALVGLPSGLLAQTPTTPTTPTTTTTTGGGGVVATLTFIGDESYNPSRGTAIGAKECESGIDLTFKLTNMPVGTNAPKKIWVLMGGSCNTEERRDGIGTDDCKEVYEQDHKTDQAQYDIKIPLAGVCESQGTTQLYFLFVNVIPTAEPVTYYGLSNVPIDTDAPSVPANVKGGSGQTKIPVNWDDSDGTPTNYWVLWEPLTDGSSDADGGDDGCTSRDLIPGMPFNPETGIPGVKQDKTNSNISQMDLSAEQIGTDLAAVAVVSEDLAGNLSLISDISCVHVVPVTGFWGDYKQSGGEVEPGCACSVPSKSGSSWSALPLSLALFGLQLRRVRRKRS